MQFLHVLQPTLFDPGGRPPTANEREKAGGSADWMDGVRTVFPRLREAGKDLVARGVPFLDATAAFRGHDEDIYVDFCHFRERGNDLLADEIAAAFLRGTAEK